MKQICLFLAMFLFLSSCYEELEVPETGWEIFDMTISPETLEYLYSSHDTSYAIEDPELELSLYDQHIYLKGISIRGRTSLDYRRKSFSIRLEFPIYIRYAKGSEIKRLTNFKLNSLCMDYTYINNRLAFGILQQSGVMPLFFKYVELRINGESQGVYLLLEDPEERSQELGSEYILRRDYNHAIRDPEYKPAVSSFSPDDYRRRFLEIYEILPQLEGEALYEYLTSRINLDQYFRKMAVDYLLQNGDYTDELYLYAQIVNGNIQYQIIPWDYDDIFHDIPHEVGRDWAVGKVFGSRSYSSHQEVLNEIGDRLVFSIEDDLDYIIAKDQYLYDKYTQTLTSWLGGIGPSNIQSLFQEISDELGPLYEQEDIILQSQYDRRATNPELWQQNMQDRLGSILMRLEMMNNHILSPDQR